MICLKEGDITLQSVFRGADGKDHKGIIKLSKAIYSFEIPLYVNMMKTENMTNFKILEWDKVEFVVKEDAE